ncbi:hypothetical protein BC938DRAFT_471801 [Jimgerdemannia flammicorona]|uniref:DNA topoisomerase n=1 Tax=Jimgerdemannia flammicorona TaxID=994334 RepID=A0A433Q7C4_9FUNG|nr:hypothetical protein BC938DRAFT_471801 [Jimgerdemannia flammicorona]
MRSDVEQQLGYIASGKASHAEVLQFYLDVFKRKFEYFVRKIEEMDGLFEATFSPLAATGKPLSKCGKCKRYMKYISLKPPRLHCMTCGETYSLPQNGDIKLYRELTCLGWGCVLTANKLLQLNFPTCIAPFNYLNCISRFRPLLKPLDDFELVSFSTGSRGIGYPLCPYCYNHPPFENIKKGMGCNHCPHPACSHSMVKNSVCACPQFEDVAACQGRMILDATSAPRWKLGCNECNLVSSFVDTINLVTLGDICKCGSRIIKVDFRQNQNREPLEGCIVCDEEMAALLETRYIYFSYSGHKLPASIMDVILTEIFYVDFRFAPRSTRSRYGGRGRGGRGGRRSGRRGGRRGGRGERRGG